MTAPFDSILLYEDEISQSRRFLPLTYTHSAAELRLGVFTAYERMRFAFPQLPVLVHTRKKLEAVTALRLGATVNAVPKGRTLLLNALALPDASVLKALTEANENATFVDTRSEVVGAILDIPSILGTAIIAGKPIALARYTFGEPIETTATLPGAIWDMIHCNDTILRNDIELLTTLDHFARIDPRKLESVGVANPKGVIIHETANVGLGVVLDATHGPIFIDEGARIMPHATIIGPVSIGRDSIIKVGAKIYEGTTIGPVCKVGGEVESSILLGYANKQHDGYVGHSYLGEWTNLGADTNTSDLKNDYSTIRVTIEGEEFQTNTMFLGLLMGDHSKCAINTQFNTGTVCGVSCNIFDSGFPPKWIPNFSWGGSEGFVRYRIDKALTVARTVMARRNIECTPEEEDVLRKLAVEG